MGIAGHVQRIRGLPVSQWKTEISQLSDAPAYPGHDDWVKLTVREKVRYQLVLEYKSMKMLNLL